MMEHFEGEAPGHLLFACAGARSGGGGSPLRRRPPSTRYGDASRSTCSTSRRRGDDTLRILKLSEVVAATLEALVSFAAAFEPLYLASVLSVGYTAPHSDLFHPFLPSSYVEARIRLDLVIRLVDVERALGLLDRHTPRSRWSSGGL
jgi:hypothetical protein